MFVIREARHEDEADIAALATHLDSVNLPANPEVISRIVDLSTRSFAESVPTDEREFLFVLEDMEKKKVIGTSMVHAQHGSRRAPHVFFQVVKDERYSESLDVYKVHQALRLGYDYNGPTELAGLVLDPAYRGHKESLGKRLSLARFLFIAIHRPLFRKKIIAELLPPLGDDGTSILWEHLGRKFTGLRYQEADKLSTDNKEFIRALFPHASIYTSLFPEEVQNVIGEVGPNTKGVEKMLTRLGFEYANQIDPFDGGPHYEAETDRVTLIKDAQKIRFVTIGSADANRPHALIARDDRDRGGFRATVSRVIPDHENQRLGVPGEAMTALDIPSEEQAWYALL